MAEERSMELRRELGLFQLTVYGVGGMLGGGIYALVGEVAGRAGTLSWLSFGVAMLVAAPTAFSYGALASRFPRSGGESVFVRRIFGSDTLALVVGWVVAFSGMVSMATLSHAFAGYLGELWPVLPRWGSIVFFLVALAVLNLRGIRMTSRANVVATAIEFSGLVLVVVAGLAAVFGIPGAEDGAVASGATVPAGGGSQGAEGGVWIGVLTGATLAFYAFIGFEDMVNVADEVKSPTETLPRAIVVALVAVGLTYVVVNVLAVEVVAPEVLAGSDAPLMAVVAEGAPWFPRWAFTLIALFAVANTALLNFVMASRLAYGMAEERLLPGWLEAVNERWRTPHRTIGVVLVLVVVLALSGTLGSLAATTSLLLLAVFAVVNAALLTRQLREEEAPSEAFHVPRLVPVLGAASALALAAFGPLESALTAALVVGAGVAMAAARRFWT